MLNDILYSSYVQGIFMQNVVLVSPSEIFSLLSATLLILVLSMRISGENFENLFFFRIYFTIVSTYLVHDSKSCGFLWLLLLWWAIWPMDLLLKVVALLLYTTSDCIRRIHNQSAIAIQPITTYKQLFRSWFNSNEIHWPFLASLVLNPEHQNNMICGERNRTF